MIIIIGLSNSIVKPIKLCVERISLLSQGDLSTPSPDINSKDETGQLAESTQIILETLQTLVADQEYILGEMAQGNFTVQSRTEYVYIGDFAILNESIKTISKSINNTLSQINVASSQVYSGSAQVASGAEELSQGTVEQSSAVEELSSAFLNISEQISLTASNAENTKESIGRAEKEVSKAKEKMQDMMKAINVISDKSNEIGKIIKAIEDIAFQTNILALNAAVEAARAGEQGRGFAVVADEVRKLAKKSTDAVNDTTILIKETVNAVKIGTSIAKETSQSIESIVESTVNIIDFIDLIATSSRQQADSVLQISRGVDQIANVVEINSATAEQSAVASEELSRQALFLRTQVKKFKLLDGVDETTEGYE